MTRDKYLVRSRVKTRISMMGYIISKKDARARTGLEFGVGIWTKPRITKAAKLT